MTADDALRELWQTQHDDETPDEFATAMRIPIELVGLTNPDDFEEN
jgi:hypothetical protein